ncbi:beta-lactamase family protein (plasmid) [Deinococcus taeanensis]|uniref:serine hydrolase domain-containing protein n=1 Tax=Deinococcus taeanensis TaxID=2737050 RepID=UPI001CDD25B9|nr:serine hydrolase domain-containing protein [Deinococcus taeanensis]UBV44433.1 beta-lactamase family protein [Deinococcus taeanensis]
MTEALWEQPPPGAAFYDALQQHAQRLMRQHHVPGAAIAVLTPTEERAFTLGVTNVERPQSLSRDTIGQIGSIMKPFTALLLLRLVEQGLLDLDAPMRTYLPELQLSDQHATQRATLRHVLIHTGGWRGDVFANTGDGDDALAKMVRLLAEQPQVTPLGAYWSYNNAGFYLAGRVVEVVTGMPFEHAARQWLLKPLGLDHSFFFPAEVMTRHFTVGHVRQNDQTVVARPWNLPRNSAPFAGLACSLEDLMQFARFMLGDGRNAQGERLLSEQGMASLLHPQQETTDGRWVGLTWNVALVNGVQVVSHVGSTGGQTAVLALVPKLGVALASMTNAAAGLEMNRALLDWFYQHLLHDEPREPVWLTLRHDELVEYEGRYQVPGDRHGFRVTASDGELIFAFQRGEGPEVFAETDPWPPARLAFHANDRVTVQDGTLKGMKFDFLRVNGTVRYLRAFSRIMVCQP